MSSDNDGFQDRLRKIQEKRNAQMQVRIEPPALPPDPVIETQGVEATRAPATRSATPFLAVLGIVALIGAGGALYLRDIAPSGEGTLVASLGGFSTESLPEIEPLTIPDASVAGDRGEDPAEFVPPAPEGWMRVVKSDAAAPRASQSVFARWRDETGADFHLLELNPGYALLKKFLVNNGDLGGDPNVIAMYFAPEGHFISLKLQFLASEHELGASNAPQTWIDTLERIEAGRRSSDQMLERLRIKDIDMTNRPAQPGVSFIYRPISSAVDTPNGLRIATPISHRAIMRLEGLFRPSDAAALVSATDRKAVMASLK